MQGTLSELTEYRVLLDLLVVDSSGSEGVQQTISSLPLSTPGPRHSGRLF